VVEGGEGGGEREAGEVTAWVATTGNGVETERGREEEEEEEEEESVDAVDDEVKGEFPEEALRLAVPRGETVGDKGYFRLLLLLLLVWDFSEEAVLAKLFFEGAGEMEGDIGGEERGELGREFG
jgi:hypothetical protein